MSASAAVAMTHLVPLAKEVDENKVTPGVLGFIVFAVMALAVWGLMKSMNRHMRKVDFEEAPETADEEPTGSSESTTSAGSSDSSDSPAGAASGSSGSPSRAGRTRQG